MLRSAPRAYLLLRSLSTATTSISNVERLRVMCTRGHIEEGLSLFYSLELEVPHSNQAYANLFHGCATYNRLRLGQALHQHMDTHNPSLISDLYVTNHLINMYAKCGHLDLARRLFDEMPKRNVVSWTALISGYAQHGRANECFGLFASMLNELLPTEFAYASVLSVCEISSGRQVHALALKTSFDGYVFVANALITMYSNGYDYGVYRDDKHEAWMVFCDMKFRNLVTWNSMIAGLQVRALWAQALSLFSIMHRDGVEFDRATLLSVFSCLSGNCGGDGEMGFRHCSQLHCLVIKSGFSMENGVATVLLKAYSRLGAEVSDCYKIFSETSSNPDIVLWTEIIAIFAELYPEKALILYHQYYHQEGLAPDSHVFSAVLKACAGLVNPKFTQAMHSQVVKSAFENNIAVANALIHAYARCGSIGLAKQVFDEMELRDTISWNSMLKAYALHGRAQEAIDLFGQMNVQADATTFVALLSACSHSGMVEEGKKIFDNMIEKYNIVPQLDHFACMVDILGRAGHILEAYKIINEMPMNPDSVVWSAFLGACRKHGETNLCNLAARKLQELNPGNSLSYVLMSNIYCSAGIFTEAGFVRREMKGLGVRKEPGLSWVEVGNQVHEFASGGQKHPQGKVIRASLELLVGKLKCLGYVPETSLALHDVEEEQKEEQLFYHSEKLALIFALMNANSLVSNGGVIRIMKNIRICVDCHNFMKVACKLVQMEIVVRDSNRFHHFREGICSCGDYW